MLTKLIAGLVIYHGVHLIPTFQKLRTNLVNRFGAGGYKGLFTLLSFVGLALIIWGYADTRTLGRANPQLWVSPSWTKHIAFLLMLPVFILLAASNIPSRIRTATKHPMLLAIKLWALAHLLVRGDLASVLLFGSFLAYAVYDRISVKKRGALGPLGNRTGDAKGDILAVGIGLAVYVLTLVWAHGALIGVPLVRLASAP